LAITAAATNAVTLLVGELKAAVATGTDDLRAVGGAVTRRVANITRLIVPDESVTTHRRAFAVIAIVAAFWLTGVAAALAVVLRIACLAFVDDAVAAELVGFLAAGEASRDEQANESTNVQHPRKIRHPEGSSA
jgi:hypothetical protein